MNEEIKQMEKATRDIERLISELQVYNYKVIINNYCIGDYHNIHILQYKPIKSAIARFLFGDNVCKLESVYFEQIRLPIDAETVKTVMNDLLNTAKQSNV